MAFRLPRLQERLPIVDSLGKPLASFLRFFNIEFAGTIERQEAAQAAQLILIQQVQQTQQDEIDRLNRVLAGTEAFSGLNVSGTDVAPFLEKTDGQSLVDSTGLAAGVVITDALEMEAVTTSDYDYVGAIVSGNTASPVTLATVSVTVDANDRVDIIGNCSIASVGANTPVGSVAQVGKVFIYRNGTALPDSERYGAVVIRSIGYGVSATVAISDIPGAGTFTYTFVSVLSGTGDVTTYDLSNRYLVATRVKR